MADVVNPASPEGMLRSYYGGDATGLSSIKDKPEDDRNILEQVRNYLTTGINEDVRYALGPNAAPAVTSLGSLLGEILGPGADIRDAVTASGETTQAVKEGDILGAGVGGLNTLASLAMMALPGSVGGAKKITEEVVSPLRRLFEDLPEETKQALPKQPNETGLYGYHGSAKGRLEEKGKDYFDIDFGNPNDQFMGEGFYFTINPKVAEEYANIRATKDFNPVQKPDPRRQGKMKDTGEYINPKTKEKATLDSLMKGVDIEGNPLQAGQNISRFNLENIEKPYIIKNNKQRLYAKENIDNLKEKGYDSILFKDFDDRSQQILVFPEHINKVSGNTTKEAIREKISDKAVAKQGAKKSSILNKMEECVENIGYANCKLAAQLTSDTKDFSKLKTINISEEDEIVTEFFDSGTINNLTKNLEKGDILNFNERHYSIYSGNGKVVQVPEWGGKAEEVPLIGVLKEYNLPTNIYKAAKIKAKKSKGGSVIESNPYNYQARAI